MTHIISVIFKTLALVCLFLLFIDPVLHGQTVTVSGAGSTSYNGSYSYDTDVMSKPSYDGGPCDFYLISWNGSQWELENTDSGTLLYTNSNDTPKPPDSDWQISSGSAAAPTMSGDVTALPFPVEFLDFEGKSVDEKTVQLSWITASELNNSGFEIQRSTATHTWETLGSIEGAGTSAALQTYTFTDSNFPTQRIAYRLKQIDFDGLYSFSRQIEVDMRNQLEDLEIYPNPVKGESLTIHIPGENDRKLIVTIRNILGQVVQQTLVISGENRLSTTGLVPGIYTLEIYFQGQSRLERIRIE